MVLALDEEKKTKTAFELIRHKKSCLPSNLQKCSERHASYEERLRFFFPSYSNNLPSVSAPQCRDTSVWNKFLISFADSRFSFFFFSQSSHFFPSRSPLLSCFLILPSAGLVLERATISFFLPSLAVRVNGFSPWEIRKSFFFSLPRMYV